ncbi:MAG TPA: FAD binding domain-containing protein [Thermoplasmata archaeon]|nr:FAD binding domain-containing protein [Thermoplasmata archaeon]
MHLDPFELHRPTTIDETVALAGRLAPDVDYIAGGTDLLPNYKMRLNVRANLIALEDVTELRGLTLDRVGAMVRLADLEGNPEFANAFPGVAEAAGEVATPLVRASGTVGGNLLVETRCFFFNQSYPWRESLGFCLKADGDKCHVVPQKVKCYATFSGDLAPSLAVVDAEAEIAGPHGRRRVPVANLYDQGGDGIRRHHLGPGELIVAVHFPSASRGLRATYRKLRIRPSYDFPELGVAVAARRGSDGRVERLALALGGLETFPRRFDELTAALVGTVPTETGVRALAEAVQKSVRPVHNTFLAAEYRKKMAGVFVRRATAHVLGLGETAG